MLSSSELFAIGFYFVRLCVWSPPGAYSGNTDCHVGSNAAPAVVVKMLFPVVILVSIFFNPLKTYDIHVRQGSKDR